MKDTNVPVEKKCSADGLIEELTERIVIEYANLSGREQANRATFRLRVMGLIKYAVNDIISDYSDWLHKKGYIDSDYYTEEPKAVDWYFTDKR